MGKVALKLNGKPLDLNPPLPTSERISAFLSKAPADELFRSYDIAECLKIHQSAFLNERAYRELTGFTYKVGPKRYWGHPKAIAELRRLVG